MFEVIDEDIRFTCHNITKKLKKNIKIFSEQKRVKTIDPTMLEIVGKDSLTSIMYILIQNLP